MTTTIHDSGYKRLFSNKTIFRQLFQTFVEEEWVQRLDFDRAERLDKSFVSEHYKDTEADIIYKVPILNSDKVIYLCLLIEFQSTVQRFMALRSLQYKCNFYMDFVLSNKDVHGKEWLAKIDNIIATLFLAEAHYDLPLLLEKLLSLYDTEPDRQALQIFINWFRQLSAHGRLPQRDFAQIEEQDLTREEVRSMLIKALESERAAFREEGKKEGIDIGVKKGIEERNRQIAQAMVAEGFALPTIAHLLALPMPVVEALLTQPEIAADESTSTAADETR